MYGRFLRDLRTSRNLTQAQLAEVVGISQPNLSAYENDRRMPTLDVANRIAVACGYLLVAEAGPREHLVPLPKVGWFPLEDLPPGRSEDPPGQEPPIARSASSAERGVALEQLLELADAIR